MSGITEENLKVLSPEYINTLIEKYKLAFFFKAGISKPASFNQLLDLVHTQTFDSSLHQILLNFFYELFNADPVFTAHAEQLKPLFKVKLADHDSLDKWPDADYVERIDEIGDEINELIVLKRLYPELTYKQLLCLWVFEYLSKTTLATNETIATVLKLADTFLKEKKFEAFALVISEVADCVGHLDEVKKHQKLFFSLDQSFWEKPSQAKDINNAQCEEIEKKLKTPPAILTLLKQAGFQKLGTNYCPVICALVSTYLLIHHIAIIHEKDELKLEDLKNEFFRLIHVPTSEFDGSDIASDIINAFYHSDFYKNQVKNKNYVERHTIEGLIDFQKGQSFNAHIKTNSKHPYSLANRTAEIFQLHHLLNIALINLLQNKNSIFKIVSIIGVYQRPDLLQTVFSGQGYWLGVLHIVVNLKEGLVNAPKGFKLETSEMMSSAPGFAFQPVRLIYKPNLINITTQESEESQNVAKILLAQKNTHGDYVDQIINLYNEITTMDHFAQTLADANEQKVISNLSYELRKDVDRFVKQHPTLLPTKKSYDNFKAKFSARLHSEDTLMSKHEHLWKVIVKNILIALLTLGVQGKIV